MTLFSHPISMCEIPKIIETSWTSGRQPTDTPQNGCDPIISEKHCLDYRVDDIQIDRLGHTVSTKKLVLKSMQ